MSHRVINPENEGCERAATFRRDHHLGNQPLSDLAAIIEQTTRIDVAVLECPDGEHGITMQDPGRTGFYIAVAKTTNPMRQRSSLAHELAHVLFEDGWENAGTTWDSRRPEEVRADSFARHLLIPQEGLKEFLGASRVDSESALSSVVQRFLVSPAIAAIALEQAGYIDARTKATWLGIYAPRLAARFGWMDQYRTLQNDSDRTRAPQRLLARAVRGFEEGMIPAQAIANLRNLPLDTVSRELQEAGITPKTGDAEWANAASLPTAHVDLDELDADLAAIREEPRGSEG